MKSEKDRDNLFIFWYCLKLIGINVSLRREASFCSKIYKYFIIFLILLYLTLSSRNNFMALMILNYIPAFHSITTLATLLMHLCLLKEIPNLKILRKMINKLSETNNKKTVYFIMYTLMFLSFLLLIVVPVAFIFIFKMTTVKHRMFGFHSIFIENLMICFGNVLYIFLCITIPTVLTCVFYAVCYQWREIIKCLKEDIKSFGFKGFVDPNQIEKAKYLVNKYRYLWKGTKLLKDTFKNFLFFYITMLMLKMFLNYSVFVKIAGNIQCIPYLIIFSFYFIFSVYVASSIPEEMEELVFCLENILEEITLTGYEARFQINKYLKLILNKQPVVLSMGGFAELRRGFIFATFGSLLSYGIIILQNG